MELNELDTLINEQTADIVTPTDEEKIFNFLEKNEPEKKNIFEIETGEDDIEEPETQEQQQQDEPQEESDQIEYGLGLSFAVMHENILPPSAKYLLETFTSKTADVKQMKLNAAQKKELAKAYEVIAQHLTSGDSPLFAATISVLSIAAGQVLCAIKDKETPKEPTVKKEAAEKKIETRGRKKKAA